jgi:type II secretory pathway predicted ATPase ExeA
MPFEISPDPKFLWMGKKYEEALAAMQYGIQANKGFLSLTGDVGTGKTTIVNALANRIKNNIIFVKILDPSLNLLDFFNFAANALEMNKTFNTKGDFLSHFNIFLNNSYAEDKKVAFIIEEAQRIDQGLLEEIRLLSNIERSNKKLINILFVGQNEFNNLLKTNKALRHRITINCRIEPLTLIETEKYILHRLKIAGSESRIFSTGAVQEIFAFTEGNPRLINTICDLALLNGYVLSTKTIDSEIIRECTANVFNPNQKSAKNIKDPRALAKTIKKTRISGLTALKDLDSGAAENLQTKQTRRKVFYMTALVLFIITCILGYLYYFDRNNAFTEILKPFLEQSLSLHGAPKSEMTAPELQMAKNTNSGNEISKLPPNQGRQKILIPQADKISDGQHEIKQLQSQLHDLISQKASTENQIDRLISHNQASVNEIKELKIRQKRIAALEAKMSQRDHTMVGLEQKLKDLENVLDQEKDSNNQLRTDLSVKIDRMLELQKQLKASQYRQNEMQEEIEKRKNEISQLQDQLSNLKTKQADTTTSPIVLDVRKTPSLEGKEIEKKDESFNPAAVIDWVLKKRSE